MNESRKSITRILNFCHFLILFVPIVIFFIPRDLIRPYAKFVLLLMIMVPLHWVFVDNYCIFTKLSMSLGDYSDSKTDSGFSENNLKWLYYPIMRLFGWEWNDSGLDKMVTLHWIINIFIVWYFCFYYV